MITSNLHAEAGTRDNTSTALSLSMYTQIPNPKHTAPRI